MLRRIIASALAALLAVAAIAGVRPRLKSLESEPRDGDTCHLIEYNVTGGERVQAYLLIPKGEGRHPGLVLLHDHGARFDIGKEKLVKPLASAQEHIQRSSEQWIRDNFDGEWFGDPLAREGYVVIVPDMLYWGSRSTEACRRWSRATFGSESLSPAEIKALKNEVYEGQRAVYDSLAAKGVIWAEQTLKEDAQAARVLAGLKQVDSRRIGAFGWSMGAHRAWLLTAFCDRIKAGCALSWMTLKALQKEPYSASEYSMLIPRLRDKMDFPDIAALLKPKPFYFLSGTEDKLFPAEAVTTCYTRMQQIYGPDSPLLTEFFPGPHHCGSDVQNRIVEWFAHSL